MAYESINIDNSLRLVQLRTDQADVLFELTDNNREYLGEYLPWVPLVKNVEDSRRHIEETIEKRASNSAYTYGIELEGKIIGDISLRNLNNDMKSPEIGYWIAPHYSGQGLTTRAVAALTSLGLKSLNLNRIVIRANPANIASNRVAQKAGYSLIRTEKDGVELYNVWAIDNA